MINWFTLRHRVNERLPVGSHDKPTHVPANWTTCKSKILTRIQLSYFFSILSKIKTKPIIWSRYSPPPPNPTSYANELFHPSDRDPTAIVRQQHQPIFFFNFFIRDEYLTNKNIKISKNIYILYFEFTENENLYLQRLDWRRILR